MKYLLIDRGIMNLHWCSNAKLTIENVIKDEKNNPLFVEDVSKAWEVRYDNGYPNVFYDENDKLYKLYYSIFVIDSSSLDTPLSERVNKLYNPNTKRQIALCYAYSKDGIEWIKPNLGVVEFQGDKNNNIVLLNAHGASVFYDEREKDKNKKYKMIVKMDYSKENNYMASGFSSDGINFEVVKWEGNNPEADTHNFAFFDKRSEYYYLITRTWKNSVRIVSISKSKDFLNWSEPKEIMRGMGGAFQVYSMPVFSYSDIFIGIASIYHDGDRLEKNFDLVSTSLTFSNDLRVFDFVNGFDEFIKLGSGVYPNGEFDCGTIYSSTPVEIDNKLYFYYIAGNGKHTDFREGAFARGYIEKDKFGFYSQKDISKDAIITLGPFSIYDKDIEILSEIEDGGYIIPEFCNRTGYEVIKNIQKKITGSGWVNIEFDGFDINDFSDNLISIRLHIHKAKIYAIKGNIEISKSRY